MEIVRRVLPALLAVLVGAATAAGCSSPEEGAARRAPTARASTTTGPSGAVTTSAAPGPTGPESVPPTVPPSVTAVPSGDDVAVERVVDGDTVVVTGDVTVRLIGVDTPETRDPRRPVECFGEEAARHLGSLLPPGTPVRLAYDVERTDRYDRTLAYVYRLADGLFVNAALVADGYAAVYTVPPNVAHVDELVALQREAREAGRGLWSACGGTDVPVGSATPTAPPAGAAGSGGGSTGCDPAYPDTCIPPPPPDLDCADVGSRRFRVLAPDPHGFDADRDGVGCES